MKKKKEQKTQVDRPHHLDRVHGNSGHTLHVLVMTKTDVSGPAGDPALYRGSMKTPLGLNEDEGSEE